MLVLYLVIQPLYFHRQHNLYGFIARKVSIPVPENKRREPNHQQIIYNHSHIGTAPEVYLPHRTEIKILITSGIHGPEWSLFLSDISTKMVIALQSFTLLPDQYYFIIDFYPN